MELLILDLDGTLFDTSERWNICKQMTKTKKDFWDCYQSPKFMHLDKPRQEVINLVKEIIAKRNPVVIVISGRSEKQLNETIRQLNEIGIFPSEIILRKEKDFRKDFEFKKEELEKLRRKYTPERITFTCKTNNKLSLQSEITAVITEA